VYYGTDTRAGALLVGCALAALLTGAPRYPCRLLPIVSGLAVAGLAAAWATADGTDPWLYRGGLTLLAVAVAAVLAHLVTNPACVAARVLSTAPLVGLGRISYGVYLWHWPLFQLVDGDRTGLGGVALFAVRIGGTLAVALAGYHLVEKPVRRSRPRWRTLGPALGTAAAAAAAVVVVATVVAAPAARLPVAAAGSGPLPTAAATSAASAPPATPTGTASARPARRPGTPVHVDVFGDSVANNLGESLPSTAGLRITDRAIVGCGIAPSGPVRFSGTVHPNECTGWDTIWRRAIARL